jgi:hypothetical protein
VLKSVAFGLGLFIVVATTLPAESRERVRWRIVDPQMELALPQDIYVEPNLRVRPPRQPDMQLAFDRSQVSVAPSEAASIAKDMVPGAKVVGVKLLPNGYYAVTLRDQGSVTRVMVSAIDGSVR